VVRRIEDKPRASGAVSGSQYIYLHETGYNNDTDSMDGVFIESADIDLGDGENFAFIKKIVPDIQFDTTIGISNTPAINAVIKRRNYPGESLTTDSTTQITPTTTYGGVRTRTRQMAIRFESDDDNSVESNRKDYKWRVGNTRLDIQASGRRG
jgi:hypothetical protein